MKWFKHETDAHTNLKLQTVLERFGMEAYGYYWACVEIIGLQGHNFRIKSQKNWKIYLKKILGVDIDVQEKFLALFADLNLINKKALENGDLAIPKLGDRSDDYTNRVRRKYEHTTDNVHLEEIRKEKNKKEEKRGDLPPKTSADDKDFKLSCKKSPSQLHSFPKVGGDCIHGCGANQNELSGRKLEQVGLKKFGEK